MEKGIFGKIRRAVTGLAETNAEKELLEKPSARHINSAFSQLRDTNEFNPEFTGELIESLANMKELKDKIGPEAHRTLLAVFKIYQSQHMNAFTEGVKQIRDTIADPKEQRDQITNFFNRHMTMVTEEVAKNQQVQTTFAGKDSLLDEAISQIITESSRALQVSFNAIEKMSQ